jgi:hypothetical protein
MIRSLDNRSIKMLLLQANSILFPRTEVFSRPLSIRNQLLIFCALLIPIYGLGKLVPPTDYLGFDWVHFFGRGFVPAFYPPWTKVVIGAISWPLLLGITFAATSLATLKRARNFLSVVSAILALPLFWTVFLGQLDGLIIFGLLGLPWLAPFALIKPQVSLFAFGARRSYLLALVLTLFLSFVIWGWWPLKMLSIWEIHAEGRYINDISIGLLGLPLALPMLWFSRGDMDMMMLSGTLISPYLLPYNLLPLIPAIARLSWWSAIICMLLSWLPLSANWLGPSGWWLGWAFVAWLWINLFVMRYRNDFPNWKKLIRRPNSYG